MIHDPRRHSAPTSPPPSFPKPIDELTVIIDLIRAEIAKASHPAPCSQIASLITAKHPAIANDWNGMGNFRNFVESLEISPVRVDWSNGGGHIYDPRRHILMTESVSRPNANQAVRADWGNEKDLFPIAAQIHDVTGVPLLSPSNYQTLFHLIGTDLATHTFDLSETGKRVRDATRAFGSPVSRSDVNWVLRSLLLRGHAFGAGEDDERTLKRKTIENLRSLCLREQMVLDHDINDTLDRWINRSA